MRAEVFLKPDQISLAIGKGGFNIKLAGKLTGYEIDVYRDSEETTVDIDDVDLIEFSDEIEESVIAKLQSVGCDTAKSVLELDADELARRTGLTIEVIEDVKQVLQSEFED
jgi:N utilization substance protein A